MCYKCPMNVRRSRFVFFSGLAFVAAFIVLRLAVEPALKDGNGQLPFDLGSPEDETTQTSIESDYVPAPATGDIAPYSGRGVFKSAHDSVIGNLENWAQTEYLTQFRYLEEYRFVTLNSESLVARIERSYQVSSGQLSTSSLQEAEASDVKLNLFEDDTITVNVSRLNTGRYGHKNASAGIVSGADGRGIVKFEISPNGVVLLTVTTSSHSYKVKQTPDPAAYIITKVNNKEFADLAFD